MRIEKLKIENWFAGGLLLVFLLLPIANSFAAGDGLDVELYVVNACDNDSICEPANGEDATSCPADCGGGGGGGGGGSGGGGGGVVILPPSGDNIDLYSITVEAGYEFAIIRWYSTIDTASTVRWGQTTEVKDGSSQEIGFAKEHSVRIENLNPGTMYFFAIESKNIPGASKVFGTYYFFTKYTVDTTFPLNPLNARAVVEPYGIRLIWQNPADPDFSYIRITRHEDHFHGDPLLGKLVYEGSAESFLDTEVIAGKKYYYSLFARNTDGDFSTGVGVSATAYSPYKPPVKEPDSGNKEPTTPTEEPEVPTEPETQVTPPEKAEEQFFVHQYDQISTPINKDKEIKIKKGKSTIVDTAQPLRSDDWMRVIDPEGQIVGQYLFSFNKETNRFQGVLPPLKKSGTYTIEIYRYVDGIQTKIKEGKLQVTTESLTRGEENVSKFDMNWIYLIAFFILWAFIVLFILCKRRKKKYQELYGETDEDLGWFCIFRRRKKTKDRDN